MAIVTVHISIPHPTYQEACERRLRRVCLDAFGVAATRVTFVPPATNGRPREAELALSGTSKAYWGGNLLQAQALIRAESHWLHTDKDRLGYRRAFIFRYPGDRQTTVEEQIEKRIRAYFGLHDAVVAFDPCILHMEKSLDSVGWEKMHPDEQDFIASCMDSLE